MQWLLKLISGWLPLGVNSTGEGKSFGEWSGKIVWVVGIFVACMLVVKAWEFFFPNKPNITTIGAGGTQIIQQAEPRDMTGFGCNMMRAYIKAGIKAK